MALYDKTLGISIDGKEGFKISVTVDGDDNDYSTNPLGMKIVVSQGFKTLSENEWEIRVGKSLTIDISHIANSGPAATCIAGCVSAMSGSLLACVAKARNKTEVIKCFQKHAPTAIITGAPCIFACLGL